MASASRAPGLAHTRGLGRERDARGIPQLHPALARGVQLRQGVLRPVCERVGQRPYDLLSGQRQARRGAAHRTQPLSAGCRRGVPVPVDGRSGTRVLKRHPPAVAQADRLLVERWLPALGLGDGCPRLVAAAAEREGRWVWHVYEDLGDESLAVQRVPQRLAAAVDFIAELHTRAAGHALLPEVRWRARDHGVHFFTANLGDAIGALEALATPARAR